MDCLQIQKHTINDIAKSILRDWRRRWGGGDYILTLLVKEMLTQSHDGRSKENSLTGSQAVNRTELDAARLRHSQRVFFFLFQQNDIYSKYC